MDTPEQSGPDPLDDLLAACLRHPHPADQEQALEQACRDFPEGAQDLRARFETLVAFGLEGIVAGIAQAASSPQGLASGARFGDFELLEVIGQGGMGIVHRARQLSLDRAVVVKLVRPELLYFEGSRKRFQREADAIARLKHKGIVPILAAGEHAGIPYFVMEFVEGRSLEALIQTLRQRPIHELRPSDLAAGMEGATYEAAVLQMGCQLADALHHSHQRGILHRDVKPSNVLLSEQGQTCLIDFGLHTLQSSEDWDGACAERQSRLTRAGSAPGTLLYMAPEQLELGIYDVRSEVYALGATLYELLTLHPPFRGENRSATERLIRAGRPAALREFHQALSKDADAVLQRALSVDPVRRYVDMRAFADDLERILDKRPVAARPDSALYRLRRWVARQPALAAALGIMLILGLVVPGLWIHKQERHNRDLSQALAKEKEARESAEDLSNYVIEVLETADPNLNEPNAMVQQILERGVEKLDTRLANRPLHQAEVRRVLARIHSKLGLWQRGRELASLSVATWMEEHQRRVEAGESREQILLALDRVVESRSVLAWLLESDQQLSLALEQRLQLEQELAQFAHPDAWEVLHARANWMRLALQPAAEMPAGRAAPSAQEYQSALRATIEAMDRADSSKKSVEYRAAALGWIGTLLVREAQSNKNIDSKPIYAEARGFLERSIEEHEKSGQADSLDCATVWLTLGLTRKVAGDLEGAEAAYQRAVQTYQTRLPANHYLLGGALVNFAALLEARGRSSEAVVRLEQANQIFRTTLGPDDHNAVLAAGSLVGARFRAGQKEGLLPMLDELLPRQIKAFGEVHPFVGTTLDYRAMVRAEAGDFAGAEADFQHAFAVYSQYFGEDHVRAKTTAKRLEELRAQRMAK